ncbi:MAG TPA: hypothetical protein VJ692_05350 [Nitrospiraceae bacterium]|nr:hypothetical protein [Nitrospiraceae bacterium]
MARWLESHLLFAFDLNDFRIVDNNFHRPITDALEGHNDFIFNISLLA